MSNLKRLITLSAAIAACSSPPRPQAEVGITGDIAFVGVTVLTMTEGAAALTGQTVLVSGDSVAAVGVTSEITVPDDATIVAGEGRFLMPSLADMHVHLEHGDDVRVLDLFLANGVTTVRNMDGRPYLAQWRDRISHGDLRGPRIFTAGPILDGDPPARDDNLAIGSGDEAREVVRDQTAAGYDFLKVYTNLSLEAYTATVEEAATQGLAVAGHVPRSVPLTDALSSGMWSIEHVTSLGALVESDESPFRDGWHWSKLYLAMPVDTGKFPEVASKVRAAGVAIVPTLIQAERAIAPQHVIEAWLRSPEMAYIGTDGLDFWEQMATRSHDRMDEADWLLVEAGRENRLSLVRALYEGGATLLAGSDTPNPFVVPGFSLHDELALFETAGVERARILALATREAARFLGVLEEVGTVEVGKRADLILLDADPRESLSTLRTPAGVMAAGRWLPRGTLAELLAAIVADGGL